MNYLTKEQRNTILDFHIFLQENRDGTKKVRTVVGGNNQGYFISKEEASSPTVATASFLLKFIIYAE